MVTNWELLDVVPSETGGVVLTVMDSGSGDTMDVAVAEESALTASLRQQFDEGTALVVQLLDIGSGRFMFNNFEAA